MNKRIFVLFLAVILFTMAGCGKTSSAPSSPQDVLDKAEEAMKELKSVHSSIVYDESIVTSDPVKRTSKNVQIQSNVELDPLQVSEEALYKIPKQGRQQLHIFQQQDQMVIKVDEEPWRQLTEEQRNGSFGVFLPFATPVMDFDLIKPFMETAEMEKVDYGYALHFSLSPAQYRQLVKNVSVYSHEPERLIHTHTGFPVVDKMDIELRVNEKTFFVTGIKLSAQVTSYFERDYIRYKQKMDATYSYFNDIDPVTAPAEAATLLQ
ncbi:hypothetical protein DV702_03800 [Sporosarcina sp. PTS2304]|uniref:DUF6612 family protein n=1 Tax=Sporosarcina sp. PTS2304 TaxID=2283194 RepID=UPI000E0D9159|nr:DUF6612 family protein [Sporosarcina sp. PTS2304]AXH98927.1 hypothetical protein DV702_03800 [Sporosarcina sp. PTS2304]